MVARLSRSGPTDRHLAFGVMCVTLVLSGVLTIWRLPSATGSGIANGLPAKLEKDYVATERAIQQLEDAQSKNDASIVADSVLQSALSNIQLQATAGDYIGAEAKIRALRDNVDGWQRQVTSARWAPPPLSSQGLYIPILIYHYTPTDFDRQLSYLEEHRYTVIGLDQVAAAMSGTGTLPPKPAVITFDDGFANQMAAFALLKKHHMTATFYIITGGPASQWCIGAGRRYGDPLQPPSGCGDAYLTWDQVRTLDRSGIVTIGGHTLDHPQLASLSADEQRHEIFASKTQIEAEIGHPIYDFAYPYGNYNQTTIDLVQAAGFRTAVTTLPGGYQPVGSPFTLRRVRSTLDLP